MDNIHKTLPTVLGIEEELNKWQLLLLDKTQSFKEFLLNSHYEQGTI